jgi:rhodanese-related sulfurtransferase
LKAVAHVTFLLDHILLVGLLIASGGMLIWPFVSRLLAGGQSIGTLEATRLINSHALVLDVRDAKEYAAGHIPGAKHIPLAELEARIGEFGKFKEKPVIVNCRNDLQSGQAIRLLTKNHFTKVYQLKRGIAAWQEASLPLER